MHQIPTSWTGRIDGEYEEYLRWHQIVQLANRETTLPDGNSFYGILGFVCDEGVRRNLGRVGAKEGANVLRKFCSNFPANKEHKIIDFGNIICEDSALENAQEELAKYVSSIQQLNGKTIVFGGGHELMFGHFSGLRKSFPNSKIGIINFDAHFDNRAIDPNIGATSGTGFWQIAQQDFNYKYLAIGIQKNSNTKVLFNTAEKFKTEFILAEDFHIQNKDAILKQINTFIENVEVLYLTVCLDVFSAAFAPGVSAVAYSGIFPDLFFRDIFKTIAIHPKLKAFDIAELNPLFDIDNHTARLAAGLIFEVII